MKVTIDRTFNYGFRQIWLRKDFELPYTPFYGMWIIDQDNDQEISLELVNNSYVATMINYYPTEEKTTIDIREVWKQPVTEETVDDILESYTKAGWERMDLTDAEEMKEFMHEQYLKTK